MQFVYTLEVRFKEHIMYQVNAQYDSALRFEIFDLNPPKFATSKTKIFSQNVP